MNHNSYHTRIEEVIDKDSGKICLPPCQKACPIGEDIQRTNAMLALLNTGAEDISSQVIRIGDEIYPKNPLFMVCGFICGLCEKECNYKDKAGAIRRKMLKRFVADYYLPYLKDKPAFPEPTRGKVALIGGGPGSLMCAYILCQKGYRTTIFERGSQLGGALRYIPKYRLPEIILNATVDSIVRIAHVEVKTDVKTGVGGTTLVDLKKEGYQAVFIASGTPNPRPLTFGVERVTGTDSEGVGFGLNLLYAVKQGEAPPDLYQNKRVIVIGGGNVAFDVARTARRLGGDVSLVCLENADKSTGDGIPADTEEIRGAAEEGIRITYSRGVQEVIGESGSFKKIKCPRCVSVYDARGFNPAFDMEDVIYLDGDILLVTIGQGADWNFLKQEGLLNEKGRLDVDPLTLMSNRQTGVFIGGDVRRVGFAAEAMRDGLYAAESIDRYLKGEPLADGRAREYQASVVPKRPSYRPPVESVWLPAAERLNFEPYDKSYTPAEAIAEATRCLYCGPCDSCKACVLAEFQTDIPTIELKEEACIRCGNCVFYCPYSAARLESSDKIRINTDLCHNCGLCVAWCPAIAIDLDAWNRELIASLITRLAAEMQSPKILVFRCQWATISTRDSVPPPNTRYIDLPCAGRVEVFHILQAFQNGIDGVVIAACPEDDCHRGRGSHEANHLVSKLKERLAGTGLDERLHFFTVSPGKPEDFHREVKQFSDKIAGNGAEEIK